MMRFCQKIRLYVGLIFLVTALFSVGLHPLLAQGGAITFKAILAQKEVVAGGSIEIKYQLVGAVGGQLRPPDFGGFKVRDVAESQGMQMINGSVEGQHTWSFSLMAPAAGNYTIPEATVILNSKTLRSNPIPIKVVGRATGGSQSPGQVPGGANSDVFATVELSHKTAYIGQQIICTVNIYTRINLSGIDLTHVPQLSRGVLKEMERYDAPQSEIKIGGQFYVKKALYAAYFFPDSPGKLDISGAMINASVSSGNILLPSQMVQIAVQPAQLVVNPLPQPVPEGFSGAVGNYQIDLKTAQDSIGNGEAFVLDMDVRGNGDPSLFVPPVLPAIEGLTSFAPATKASETFENGREQIHTQTLQYTISAKSEGSYTCTPIMVWFDPDSNKYVTYAKGIPLKVGPASIAAQNHSPLAEDTSSGFWLTPQGLGLADLLLAGVLAMLYFFLAGKQQESPPKQENRTPVTNAKPKVVAAERAFVPPPPPKTAAEIRPDVAPSSNWDDLARLLYDGSNQAVFFDQLYKTIRTTLAGKMQVAVTELDPMRIEKWMEQHGYSPEQSGDMQWLLRTCEQVLYAAQNHASEREQALATAKKLLVK